ncbi:L-serine ammonia-lyase [Herbiconiux moechotypicola]|uniref:L-serine ammonia-lyase n=1 Tax=Herbiconiux moechotypicola TaxID=637393 RepID=A0ABP5QXN2_9MICO|nr:L-serine ammonia-lyase [Herbiconiux moechotypicola]MCS5731163.1 L-serine ammonia-lyase [Herbiconiux moechotypicola]
MTVSTFDLFRVGIGPSSSHTVGPMRAALRFADELRAEGLLGMHGAGADGAGGTGDAPSLQVELFGSLAATGHGHGTLPAVLLGLDGWRPERLTVAEKSAALERIEREGGVRLGPERAGDADDYSGADTDARCGDPTARDHVFAPLRAHDIVLHRREVLARHPNGLRFTARTPTRVLEREYFSIGGGFVVGAEDATARPAHPGDSAAGFGSGSELLARAAEAGSVSAAMLRFETRGGDVDDAAVRSRLLHIRSVMEECAHAGMSREGVLPGALEVPRRAQRWHRELEADDPGRDPAFAEDWVNLVAIAVNEENASGGRVVTAPTNGAAGIIPAVLHYALEYTPSGRRDRDGTTVRFLLAAGAVGSLFKERASISGAEVGCQGEVGSAASMAAAGLAEVLGGTPAQVENAAEIAMEHSLGLTCDPIGGLVQIPCIERNAISAGKAVNAARMALRGDGSHRVSLDQVIETMRQTGLDMHAKYKETARGGLAVNVPVSVVDC